MSQATQAQVPVTPTTPVQPLQFPIDPAFWSCVGMAIILKVILDFFKQKS